MNHFTSELNTPNFKSPTYSPGNEPSYYYGLHVKEQSYLNSCLRDLWMEFGADLKGSMTACVLVTLFSILSEANKSFQANTFASIKFMREGNQRTGIVFEFRKGVISNREFIDAFNKVCEIGHMDPSLFHVSISLFSNKTASGSDVFKVEVFFLSTD